MSKHAIEIYPGYKVSREGKVFSTATNWRGYGERELQQTLNSYGYPRVRMMVGGKRKSICVHVLVARAFLGPKPSARHQVRHLDGNRNNSHVDNLAWGTAKQNAEDRSIHGTTSRGQRHSTLIRNSAHKFRVRRGQNHYITMRAAAIRNAEEVK